jgi:hypothetical protein
MKVLITFKDPDALSESLEDQQFKLRKSLISEKDLTLAGAEAEADARMLPVRKLASKFFQYGEYVTIELDSELGTATVVEAK